MATLLAINTSPDWPKGEKADLYISGWAHKLKKWLDEHKGDPSPTREMEALNYARKQTGFECCAAILITLDPKLEIAERLERLYLFADFFENCNNCNDPTRVAMLLELLEDNTDQAFLAENMIWVHTKSTPFEFDLFAYRCASPRIQVVKEEAEQEGGYSQERFESAFKMSKSASQRAAFKTALEIVAASKLGLKGLGVQLKRNMLVVGPSGSGKSWVCNRIAHFLGMKFVTVTLSSWHLRGGSGSERPTCDIIFEAVEKGGPALIVCDELDKFRQSDSDNKNYFRSTVDELMGLMDGRVQIMTCSSKAAQNLRKSIWIGCGAFQDLYRKKLGEVSFAEEIDAMPPLTVEDIRQSGWLSEELMNRFCADLLEIRPPNVAETTEHLQRIIDVVGAKMGAKAVNARAEEIVKSMQSIRGIEKFAMDCARARVRQDVDIIKNGGF